MVRKKPDTVQSELIVRAVHRPSKVLVWKEVFYLHNGRLRENVSFQCPSYVLNQVKSASVL